MQTLYLARALLQDMHNVEVACYFQFDSAVVEEFEKSSCKVALLNLKKELGLVKIVNSLRKFFLLRCPDVVHVQYMAPGALPVLAARFAGIKRVVATVHQPYTPEHGIHAKLLLRSAAMLCDYFIAVSTVAESSWFGKSGGVAPGIARKHPRHFTLHNAVDVSRVATLSDAPVKKTLPVKNELATFFVFGYVGRLRREKGVDILFDAFGKVYEKYNSVRLLVVGDGPDLSLLQEKSGGNEWWDNVVFAGQQPWEDAMKYFSAMDVAIVPSRFEGFGLTALEAMASSLPVIASNTGGLKEVIEDSKSGMLFEQGSVDGLARSMMILFENPGMRAMLSENAKKRASAFDFSLYNKRINNFYKTLEWR